MKPYIPFYHRSPNTFIRYEEREFTLECGKKGMERVAIYKDRNGKIKEEIAQVKWYEI